VLCGIEILGYMTIVGATLWLYDARRAKRQGPFLVSFSLPLRVCPAIFVLHESATAHKHADTKINAVCFVENIEILG